MDPEKKRLFRTAMLYFGYTRESWAKEHGISTGFLDQIRGGFTQSDRVMAMIDATIARFRREVVEHGGDLPKPKKKSKAAA